MFGLPKETMDKVERYASLFNKIYKNCLKAKNEDILIISDYGNENSSLSSMMSYGYFHAAKQNGFNVDLLFQEPKKGFMQTDVHIVNALKRLENKSIVILALSNKLGRFGETKSFRGYCKEQGHRFISSTGLGDVNTNYFELFMEAMNVNYPRMKKRGLVIKKKWDKASEITVKTDAGTNLVFNVEGKEAISNVGDYYEDGMGGNMPCGEVYIPPKGLEGVEGTLIIDASMKIDTGALLVDEPLELTVEKGKVTSIKGKNAPLLEAALRKFQDRAKYPHRVRLIGELGVGINPGAVVIGSMIMDEKVMGTGHIALGSNYWFGGDIKTIFHGDQVFKSPRYYVNGVKMEI
ncbi:MAG: aminopeptidase [Candidatus Woesearchaeota archaeon]